MARHRPGGIVTTLQVEFTETELLADHDRLEPLVVDSVRCHGGFDADGDYVSPRTKFRWPAIAAWEEQRVEQFGTPILDIPLETWPEGFPNVAQSKLLLRHDVTEPTVVALTRIGTIEGFGAMLRHLPVPDFASVLEVRRSRTSGAACSRRTPATRPDSATSPVTTRCGSSLATSPSSTR
jgi:hypothetical protein